MSTPAKSSVNVQSCNFSQPARSWLTLTKYFNGPSFLWNEIVRFLQTSINARCLKIKTYFTNFLYVLTFYSDNLTLRHTIFNRVLPRKRLREASTFIKLKKADKWQPYAAIPHQWGRLLPSEVMKQDYKSAFPSLLFPVLPPTLLIFSSHFPHSFPLCHKSN